MKELKDDRQYSAYVEELFQTYYASLVRVVYRMLKDKNASEDIVQDVFFKVWNSRINLDENRSVKSYLYRSAVNTAINFLEKNKKSSKAIKIENITDSLQGSFTEDKLNAKELEIKVSTAIELLPPKCKAIFIMSRYDELSYKEIAEALEISIKTVENQIGKALNIMREQLRSYLK